MMTKARTKKIALAVIVVASVALAAFAVVTLSSSSSSPWLNIQSSLPHTDGPAGDGGASASTNGSDNDAVAVKLRHRGVDRDGEANEHRGRSLNFFGSDIHYETTVLKLPDAVENYLVDWDEADNEIAAPKATPIFWHVPKSGGTNVKSMYATCYSLVEACETGVILVREEEQLRMDQGQQQQHQQQQQEDNHGEGQEQGPERRLQEQLPPLRVITTDDGRRFVDVDTTTLEGLYQSSERGLVPSGLADVIFTPLIIESTQNLFDNYHKGRMFALFRHPVQRVVSMFYYIKQATHEPTFNELYATMTLEEYAHSPYVESDWMVRSLVGKMEGEIVQQDFELAKEILRRKCLVGLLHRLEESIDRFNAHFSFGSDKALECAKADFVKRNSYSNRNKHDNVDRNSELYQFLLETNSYDVQLFHFVTILFEEQGHALMMKNDSRHTPISRSI